MIKNLVAAGCSFVAGSSMGKNHKPGGFLEWDVQQKYRFSNLLAMKLNANEFNIAGSGGSNQRSIRLIYEWIKKNKAEVENTIFVLGLTELLRKEKFSTKTQSYIKWRNTVFFEDNSNLDNLEDTPQKLLPSSFDFHKLIEKENLLPKLKEYAKMDVLYFTDIAYESNKLTQNLEMLKAYIESKKGKLLVFSAMLENTEFIFDSDSMFNFETGSSWREYISSYDKYYSFSRHPALNDNNILANILFKKIQNETYYTS